MTTTQRPTDSELVETLKSAIDATYHALQATIKDFREFGLYEGGLRLKWAEMKRIAREMMEKLEADIAIEFAEKTLDDLTISPHSDEVEDQIVYHRQFLSPETVPAIVKKWLDNKDKGAIVAVLNPETELYMTYASHAREMLRASEWDASYVHDGITTIEMQPRFIWHTQNVLRRKGRELTIVD